jgi:hypothetical protein
MLPDQGPDWCKPEPTKHLARLTPVWNEVEPPAIRSEGVDLDDPPGSHYRARARRAGRAGSCLAAAVVDQG